MPAFSDPVLPALLTVAASAVFILYAALRVFLMYRKKGAKAWSQAQTRFAWRFSAVMVGATLPPIGAWMYLTAFTPIANFWPYAVSAVAFLIVYALAMAWYERRLFALAD